MRMFSNRIIARQVVARIPFVMSNIMDGSCSSILVRRSTTTSTTTINNYNYNCKLRRLVTTAATATAGTQQSSPSLHSNNNNLNKNQSSQDLSQFSSSSSSLRSSLTTLIINAVGIDRVGIVHDMTKEVINVGGNVGSSQAAKLGNYFSFMMLVNVPTSHTTTIAAVETLTMNLQNIKDLSVIVANANANATSTSASGTDDESTTTTTTIGYKGRLMLEGADNPGIVNKVTKILSNNGLNINTLETSDEVAPHGGTVLFRMKGTAHAYEPLSSGFNANKIKQELIELGDDLNCDIDLIDESMV